MNGDGILEVLKEIRDEAKQTNARLDQTNARLESLEGRVDFLEKRTTKGFEELGKQLEAHAERIHGLAGRRSESELRLATEVTALADVTRQVRDLLSSKLDDHATVIDHERRIRSIQDRIADAPPRD